MPKLSISVFLFLFILGALTGLTPFAVDMYLPSIVQISQDIGQPESVTQQSITVFLFVFATTQLFYGPLSDSYGRKRILLIGLTVFTIASLLITTVDNITQLLLFRALQASGGGAITVCVTATIRDYFDGNKLAKTMSHLLMIIIIAPMIAPFVGGLILLHFNWQAIFYLLALLALVFGICFVCLIEESHPKEKRRTFSIRSTLNGYIAIIKHPQSLAYILLGGFSSAPMFVFITNSPSVYQVYLGISAQNFGFFFGANVAAMMLSSWLNTKLLNRFHYLSIMHTFIWIRMIPISMLFIASLSMNQHVIYYLVPGVVLSLGMLPLVGPNASTAVLSQHGKLAGSASSIAGFSRFGVGAIAGALASFTQTNNDHISMVVWMFIFTLLCLFMSLWIKRNNDNVIK